MALNPIIFIVIAAGAAIAMKKKPSGGAEADLGVVDGGAVTGPLGTAEWRVRKSKSGDVFSADFRLNNSAWLTIDAPFASKEEAASAGIGAATSAAGLTPGESGYENIDWAALGKLVGDAKKAKAKATRKKIQGSIGI